MELPLHYVWKHKLFPLRPLTTTTGLAVEVIDPGLHNSNAGPDFFNAKLKVGGMMWVGNVEIHDRASDWYRHGHDRDRAYDNVVLHVVGKADVEVTLPDGRTLPQMELEVPPAVAEGYHHLMEADRYPPCRPVVSLIPQMQLSSWLDRLLIERLERKTDDICRRVERCDGSWESALFVTLARNFGFGVNSDAFEAWAYQVPLGQVAHHRDNLLQVEALFLGQAGLLSPNAMQPWQREEALRDPYYLQLQNEYTFLAHKFRLQPIPAAQWRFLRLRPQNFPHIRLSQLACLYHSRQADLSRLVECTTLRQLFDLLTIGTSDYWKTHYTFGSVSTASRKQLSPSSLCLLVINTAVPMLFAYGRYLGNEALTERALSFLEALRPENNYIVRMWQLCGIPARSAADSQALIQLKTHYCDRKDCLHCRIGYEALSRRCTQKNV